MITRGSKFFYAAAVVGFVTAIVYGFLTGAAAHSGVIGVFQDGDVVHAIFGKLRGTHAFYALLKLRDGDFGLDPSFTPTVRVIEESAEMLLLEGMRRLDEGLS